MLLNYFLADSWFLQFMAGQYLESIIVISVLYPCCFTIIILLLHPCFLCIFFSVLLFPPSPSSCSLLLLPSPSSFSLFVFLTHYMNLVVIVLFGFTLYDDIITCPKGSINWHGIFLKLLAICSSAGMSRGE